MKRISLWLAALGVALAFAECNGGVALAQNEAQQPTAEQKAYLEKMRALGKSMHPQTGDVALTEAKATLHLGQDYYFLNAADSRKVIVEAWGNPAEQADGVLGMVFPKDSDFLDPNGWGAVVTYEQEGHVADDDAAKVNFDELLSQMREGESERNKERADQGFAPTHLVGWAERPAYDGRTHSVVWARDIQFGQDTDHSLNYDVRLLGRNGVLSLNMVSTMSHLAAVKAAARKFTDTATFDSGFAYKDYVEGVDKAAGYGIGGLIATGVGVAAAKKLGLLAIALGFGKKIIVFILIGFAAAWRWIKKLFGIGKEEAMVFDAVPAEGAMESDGDEETPVVEPGGPAPES